MDPLWMAAKEHLQLPALSLGTDAKPGLQGTQASVRRTGRAQRRDQSVHQKELKPRFYTALETHRLRYRIAADPASKIPSDYDPPAERARREQADQAMHRLGPGSGDMRFSGARGCLDGLQPEYVSQPYTEMYRLRLQEDKRLLRHCLAHGSFRFATQGALSGKPPVYTPLPPALQGELRQAAQRGRPHAKIPRGAQTVR